jgi:hypothetical protein
MAERSNMLYLKRFAKALRDKRAGICNYAKHRLTTAGSKPAISASA